MTTARCFIEAYHIIREDWKQWIKRLLPIVVIASVVSTITEVLWHICDINLLLPSEVLLQAGYPVEVIGEIIGDKSLLLIILCLATILCIATQILFVGASAQQIRATNQQRQHKAQAEDGQADTKSKSLAPIMWTPKLWLSAFCRGVYLVLRNIHKRIGVLILSLFLLLILSLILQQPAIVLIISSQASTISGMMSDATPTPSWVWVAMSLTMTLANMALFYTLNYCCWCISKLSLGTAKYTSTTRMPQ